jgi:hypothetical protein
MTVSPNPYADQLTVEFDVAEAHTHVRLDIIDAEGKVVKTVTNVPHDAGHWRYPITNLPRLIGQQHYCRLQVGQVFETKRLLAAE